MKRILLLLSMFIFLIGSSCNKDKKTLELSIDGLSDIALNENNNSIKKMLPLSVNQKSISDKNISLSLEGVPEGVDISLSAKSGVPNFSTTLNVQILKYLSNGIYPVKIIAKNDAGLEKTFPFNIIVDFACYEEVIGNYTLTETIDGVESIYYTNLYVGSTDRNMVTDNKYFNEVILDCNKKTARMDTQYIYYNGSSVGTIYGSGTFTNKEIILDCIIIPNGGASNKPVKRVFTRK